jgi:ABC-type lipoprotein release transport system permease subunit
VVAHIVRRGWALAAAGSALGLAATVAAGERLSTLLYGVRPMDPVVLLAAVLALLMTATLASFMPAWRASRTDASVVLRQQ